MERLYNVQRKLFWIPFISTLLLAIYTEVLIAQRKSARLNLFKLVVLLAGAVLAALLGSRYLLSGVYPLLNFIFIWGILTLANLFMLEFQKKLLPQEAVEVTAESAIKYVMITVFVIPLIVAIVFCSVVIIQALNSNNDISDLNGADDYSLNTLVIGEMISVDESGMIFHEQYQFGGDSTAINGRFEKTDRDTVTYRGSRFSGWSVVQSTLTDSDTVTFTVNSRVQSGNFAIFVVVDGVLYCEIPVNQAYTLKIDNASGKTITVKAAGESAEFTLDVARAFS